MPIRRHPLHPVQDSHFNPSGVTLPTLSIRCAARPMATLNPSIPHASIFPMPPFHRLTIKGIRRETPLAVSITFSIPDTVADRFVFRHGQYLTLEANISGERIRRCYSICSGEGDGEVRVAIKEVVGGRFSRFANQVLKTGDELDVMEPTGQFTVPLEPTSARTYLAVACGSGITPIMSICKTVLAREPNSHIMLIYGNRTPEDILFRSELKELLDRYPARFNVNHVLSREAFDASQPRGRIDGEKVSAFLSGRCGIDAPNHTFLCGPHAMVESVRERLHKDGVSPSTIHSELFSSVSPTGATASSLNKASLPSDCESLDTEIRLDGHVFVIGVKAGETIVEAARRAGVDVPFSCNAGVCCTCRAKILDGQVLARTSHALDSSEVDAGFVLTCQACPATRGVVIDYDAQ